MLVEAQATQSNIEASAADTNKRDLRRMGFPLLRARVNALGGVSAPNLSLIKGR